MTVCPPSPARAGATVREGSVDGEAGQARGSALTRVVVLRRDHYFDARGAAMPPIFEGLRVLDLSQNVAGAVAGMIFSDHGAEVLKVEPPTGNPGRDLAGWLVWGRGARSVVVDLDHPAGRDVLLNLLASSDVLLESFTPGVMAAW